MRLRYVLAIFDTNSLRMRVTIAQGRFLDNQVFEGVKNFLLGTIETKGKRLKPFITFNFIENDEYLFEELSNEEVVYTLNKIKLDVEVDSSSPGKIFEYFFDAVKLIRRINQLDSKELVIYLTGERNNRNFLGFTDDTIKNTFIYTSGWERIYSTRIDSIYPIVYEIFSWILRSEMFDSVENLYKSSHFDNESCIMDFCEELKDHKFKSRSADICEACSDILFNNTFPEDIKQYVIKSMDKVREMIMGRDLNNMEVKSIELKYINGELEFVVPGLNNLIIKFPPQAKAVFHFFLKHPDGISYKKISDYRYELSQLYKRFTNREADNIEIEITDRLLGLNQGPIYDGSNNLSGAINMINLTLKTIFNNHIIDNYLLKKSKDKFTVALNRDLFVDRTIVL